MSSWGRTFVETVRTQGSTFELRASCSRGLQLAGRDTMPGLVVRHVTQPPTLRCTFVAASELQQLYHEWSQTFLCPEPCALLRPCAGPVCTSPNFPIIDAGLSTPRHALLRDLYAALPRCPPARDPVGVRRPADCPAVGRCACASSRRPERRRRGAAARRRPRPRRYRSSRPARGPPRWPRWWREGSTMRRKGSTKPRKWSTMRWLPAPRSASLPRPRAPCLSIAPGVWLT